MGLNVGVFAADETTVQQIIDLLAAAGHPVVAHDTVPDDRAATTARLTTWITDAHLDVVISIATPSTRAALMPLITKRLLGFSDLRDVDGARCDSTIVVLLPKDTAVLAPALDKALPRIETELARKSTVAVPPLAKVSIPAAIKPPPSHAKPLPAVPAAPPPSRENSVVAAIPTKKAPTATVPPPIPSKAPVGVKPPPLPPSKTPPPMPRIDAESFASKTPAAGSGAGSRTSTDAAAPPNAASGDATSYASRTTAARDPNIATEELEPLALQEVDLAKIGVRGAPLSRTSTATPARGLGVTGPSASSNRAGKPAGVIPLSELADALGAADSASAAKPVPQRAVPPKLPSPPPLPSSVAAQKRASSDSEAAAQNVDDRRATTNAVDVRTAEIEVTSSLPRTSARAHDSGAASSDDAGDAAAKNLAGIKAAASSDDADPAEAKKLATINPAASSDDANDTSDVAASNLAGIKPATSPDDASDAAARSLATIKPAASPSEHDAASSEDAPAHETRPTRVSTSDRPHQIDLSSVIASGAVTDDVLRPKRRRTAWPLIGVLGLALAAGAILIATRSSDPPSPTPNNTAAQSKPATDQRATRTAAPAYEPGAAEPSTAEPTVTEPTKTEPTHIEIEPDPVTTTGRTGTPPTRPANDTVATTNDTADAEPTPAKPTTTKPSTTTKPATIAKPAAATTAGPVSADGCDKVSCVIDAYARPCCSRFRPRKAGETPYELDKAMITAGMARAKAAVIRCGEEHPTAKGIVRIAVTIAPAGGVSQASVAEAPDAALGECVAAAVRRATFAASEVGASVSYPFKF